MQQRRKEREWYFPPTYIPETKEWKDAGKDWVKIPSDDSDGVCSCELCDGSYDAEHDADHTSDEHNENKNDKRDECHDVCPDARHEP